MGSKHMQTSPADGPHGSDTEGSIRPVTRRVNDIRTSMLEENGSEPRAATGIVASWAVRLVLVRTSGHTDV